MERGKFAFIFHPLDYEYVYRYEPGARGKNYGLIEKILEWVPPFKISDITGIVSKTGAEVDGWFLVVPLLPKQMLEMNQDFVMDRIIEAGKIGEELGAKILGLGAYTSVVGDAGITVDKNLNIPVTTGNSYTVAVAMKALDDAARRMNIEMENSVGAVVGATGSIGSVCAKMLAKKVSKLNLIGRNMEKLETLKEKIKNSQSKADIFIMNNVKKGIPEADVVITMTSSAESVIEADDLKSGSVVCDIARPRDVSREVADKRNDVLVIDGGAVYVPGEKMNFNFYFGYPPRMAYGCMSETIMLALENRYENFSMGRELSIEKVEEIDKIGDKHGFKLAGLRSFDQYLKDEKIEEIRENARRKRAVA